MAFVGAINSLITNKDEVIAYYRANIRRLTDTTEFEEESIGLKAECNVVVGLIEKIIAENAHTPLNQAEYERRYNKLARRYDAFKQKLDDNESQRLTCRARCEKLTEFIDRLDVSDGLLTGFDEGLWNATVESVTVLTGNEMTFVLKGGVKLDWTR